MPKYPYLSMKIQVPMNEKGSALPSALLFLFLLSAFLMSLSQTAKHQIISHKLMQDSYRAQTLLILTEEEIRQKEYEGGKINAGDYIFNVGTVHVEESVESLQLTARLANGFIKAHTLPLEVPVKTDEEERKEEIKKEKIEENKNSGSVEPIGHKKENDSSNGMGDSIKRFEGENAEKTEDGLDSLTKELNSPSGSKDK